MPRFAANLTMLFTEYPFMERFDRAAAVGFKAVEFLFPYEEEASEIRAALDRNGLEAVLFNLPVGDFAAGDRGLANDPGRTQEFRAGVARALEYAAVIGNTRINCLVGLRLADVPLERQWETIVENLRFSAEQLQSAGVRQVIEPLNSFDAPGFLVTTTRQGLELLDRIGHPNISLQYDVYHAQRMEGNITATIREHLARIGHIQIADSPGRNEPGTGEINYPYVFAAIDGAGYDGWVSLEYRPSGRTEDSLDWMRASG
jgi:hydroxypyruvate isomerase